MAVAEARAGERMPHEPTSDRVTSIALWCALGAYAVVRLIGRDDQRQTLVVIMVTACVFVAGLARVLVTAGNRPSQRRALLALAAALVLWAAGSAVVLGATDPGGVMLPLSPAEWWFLASYLGFVPFILLDANRHMRSSPALWCEAAALTGAAACLAGGVLLLPAASSLGAAGLPVLVALLYPLCDIVLVLLIVGQMGLRQRPVSARSVALIAGFLLLAVADTLLFGNLSNGRYEFPMAQEFLWLAALVVVVQAACTRRARAVDEPNERMAAVALLLPAGIAVLVLALPYPQVGALYVTVPAIITLVAVGTRMVIALEQARAATDAYRRTLRDDLTGLPNRRGIVAALRRSAPSGPAALVLVGVDGFKDVNESFGHASGDDVLRAFGQRLQDDVPDAVVVGRLESDVFAVALRTSDTQSVLATATSIRAVLAEPILLADLEVELGATAGAAVRTPDEAPDRLLQRAHLALRQAKAHRSGVLIFSEADDDTFSTHLREVDALRRALQAGDIEVWYQPQVDAVTKCVVGVEGLVRWRAPSGQVRPPSDFLPVARRSGLMAALTKVVMIQAVSDAARWAGQGRRWRVSINVAPPELMSGAVIPELIDLIEQARLSPGSIVVEVTEESFLSDAERAMAVLQQLNKHGVDVAFDDYGTGFSALAYLRDLHAQELKIDRSFVQELRTAERARRIVRSTVQMAHALGLRVVAEGVEDDETAGLLVGAGIDVLQGFLLARPMPPRELDAWVESRHTEVGQG